MNLGYYISSFISTFIGIFIGQLIIKTLERRKNYTKLLVCPKCGKKIDMNDEMTIDTSYFENDNTFYHDSSWSCSNCGCKYEIWCSGEYVIHKSGVDIHDTEVF